MSETFRDQPVLFCPDAAAWEGWLAGATVPSIWLKLAKKDAPLPCITKPEAIEGAIAHGWIDGQLQPWDAHHFLTRFTPRKPGSRWSAVNVATAERLLATRRMAAAGLAEVEAARADGRWAEAYQPASRAEVPADLQAALDADPAAAAFFATLTGSNRYAVLYRLGATKTKAGREGKIAKLVAMLARGETFH